MKIDDQIRDEKLQCDINREAAKISDLSSNKFIQYEYLTGEEILQSNQKQMIQQAKFTYSPIDKAFKKQIKTIQHQREKQNQGQVKTIKIYDYDDEDSPLISKVKKYLTLIRLGFLKVVFPGEKNLSNFNITL